MISGRPPRWTDKQLEWAARKAAGEALRADDVLLDIEVGNLKRFRDNGIEKAVSAEGWANYVPATRGLMTVTYTVRRVLFLSSNSPGFYYPLVCIHRAQLLESRHQLFAFSGGDGTLGIVEFEQAGRRGSARPGSFVDRLVTARDAERAKLPAVKRESLERLDTVVQAYSIDELWARPSAPVSMESDDIAALAGLERGGGAGDGIDEVAWSRLRVLVAAATRRDAVGFAQTGLWQPPGFGLAGHQRTGIYLLYLLWSRVREELQTSQPTTEHVDTANAGIPPRSHLADAVTALYGAHALGLVRPAAHRSHRCR